MSLLKTIMEAVASSEPSLSSPTEYPIVIDSDPIFPTLKPKLDNPDASSLASPIMGWEISQSDSELIGLCKEFFTLLKQKLKSTKRFDKEDFLRILKPFLARLKNRVGIWIAVDSSNDGYTRALIEKVGFLMGNDVAGLVLEACTNFEIWELVETLIINGLVGKSSFSDLIPRLVAKKRADLLCLCIKHASDLGLSELLLILKYILASPKDARLNNVRKEWENQALLAIETATDKSLTGKVSLMAKEASILLMMAYDGFSSSELCLHYLIASANLDEVVLSSATSKLNGKEMMYLIEYLGKWLKKYERFPQAIPCPKAASVLGLKACDWVPKLEDVVKCVGLVLDENFSSLVLHPEFHEELKSMEEVVSSLSFEGRFSCSVANIVEKLKRTEV